MTILWRHLSSAEKIELIKTHADKGCSAREISDLISKDFGTVSRNAVLGACHRAGVQIGTGLGRRKLNNPPKARPSPRQPRVKPERLPVPVRAVPIQKEQPSNTVKPPRPVPEEVSVIPRTAVPLMELTDRVCKLPIRSAPGVVGSQLFCGCKKDPDRKGPYCPEHAAVAFIPVEPRPKRVRR